MGSTTDQFSHGNDIAVVGFSFKLPQDVEDVDSLWHVLQNRQNLMTRWPESRINAESFVSGTRSKFSCHGGHFINGDPAAFDAPFFSISTKEAAAMDPMQRWTLETSYRAFENAGVPAEKLKGSRTGVFSASFTDDWARMLSQDPENVERTAATGTAPSLISNRVSWYFDLRGPSVHVDTACSSSLFAVDMACQSLRAGESSAALVTGSSLILTPTFTHFLSNLGFLSPDSKCWAFDHRANGYARGEGFIAILLKPLSAALRDNDMIRSVIRATGSNQDGQTPSLTQPNPRAQEELIRHVYKKANLSLGKTRYVEAHGTGTPVGDPIEMKAIGRVFRSSRSASAPLYVGSIKSNIGHLEGSSGLAGVIKSIVSLEKGLIPPHALFEKINPDIDLEFYHTAIPIQEIVWPSDGLRRISVNSFGFGGTNTHVVLDDAYHYLQDRGIIGNHCTVAAAGPASNDTTSVNENGPANGCSNGCRNEISNTPLNGINHRGHGQGKSRLLVWSAADEKAVKRMVEGQQAFFNNQVAGDAVKLDQFAYTLAARRSRMLWRAAAIVTDEPNDNISIAAAKPVRSSGEAGLAFVFTGQGAQYAGMGWDLVHQYPIFDETLQRIGKVFNDLGCEWQLVDELQNADNINYPEYSQPLSTAIQLALVDLLKSFNILPKAVIGHSSGEIAAAYAIGALSLESACKVSYFRGQLAGKLRATSSTVGAMISINLAEDHVPAYLGKLGITDICVACVNSPLNCTLSGPESAIDAVKEQADKDGIFARKLKTGVAYHSPAMLAIADDYKQQMGHLELATTSSASSMISTVTGNSVSRAVLATAQYWVDNMVSPVRFVDAVRALSQQSSTWKAAFVGNMTDLVEIGPTAALRRPVADSLASAGPRAKKIRYASVLYRGRSAVETTLEFAGHLFTCGHSVSIAAVNQLDIDGHFLVDCPEYPFDHSNRYWSESRISRDYRLRGAVVGEILGQRVSDWNPFEPRWRNFLCTEFEPWIADHNVSNTVVYPAAGMLVMAMEAVQQMVPANRTVVGYSVKEARFMSPIVVGETWEDRTETTVELRPVQKPFEKSSTWFDIRIFCYRNKEWSQCFSARIQVQYEEDSLQVGVQKEKKLLDQDVLARYERAVKACTRPVDSHVFYRNAADHGLRYRDWFQLLEDLHWDGKNTAVARIDVSKTQFHSTSLVHPAVLDNVFHMLRASSQASASTSATNVPVRIVDAWFSASGWQSPQIKRLACYGIANVDQEAGEDGTIYALGDDGKVLMTIQHMITVAVSRSEEGSITERKLLHKAQWKPQLSLLDPQQLTQACVKGSVVKDDATMVAHHAELTSIMNIALDRTLRNMTVEEREKVPVSLERHMAWVRHHISTLEPGQRDDPEAPISDQQLEQRLEHIEGIQPPWKLHTSVVRELKNILLGAKDPLEVIFDSDLADVFYADMFAQICDERLRKFLDLASHENPGLRILEVGAGTGGFTGHVLTALQSLEKESGGLKLAEYTYTDISPMFFERARERWRTFEGRISFKTLDLERTLESQGFEVGSYDLVVAGSVLHATADLVKTMKNVRTALKAGGRALILEVVAPEDVVVNFSFGLVPGWWLAREEWRKMSPLLNESQWDTCLQASGYSGNDLVLKDYEGQGYHICSIIVSTAVEAEATAHVDVSYKVLLVVEEASKRQVELANHIHNLMSARSGEQSCSIMSLQDFQAIIPARDDVVLCLASLDNPFLYAISESKLGWVQHLMRHTGKLLWVSGSSIDDDTQSPFYSLAQGFFRSLRLEVVESKIVTLAIETRDATAAASAQHVIKVLLNSFLDPSSEELEYVVSQDGLLETCRAAEDVRGNDALNALLSPHSHSGTWSEGPALSLSIKTVGTLDSLCFTEDLEYDTELAADEVEIEAKAWGVNFRDVLQALGRLEERTFGVDCAGIVTRLGSGCNDNFQLGDRVCMASPGCMRRSPRGPTTSVIKIPSDDMSFAAAASVIVPGMTAYHTLIDVARLAKGESVLIHSAAGATGQMAIAVAKMRGASIYATVGSEEKKRFLVDILGIPEDNIFHSRNTSFAQGVMRVTKGRGVDVVLNSLSGDALQASWSCIARRGRFIEIGKADIIANSALPMSCFERNVSFSAVDLREILMEDPQVTAELLHKVMQFTRDTGAAPAPVRSFPASQVEQAFRTLQNGKNIGRIVIEPGPDDIVPKYLLGRQPWKFDSNASYLIAGGSGGIGRAIMKWMAARGANYLIVPSRSGASSPEAAAVIAELESQGVLVVAPKCDVASELALSSLLDECARTMPPIKGCINAALVLQDALFENMTLAQWDLAVRAKVDTAWNLHRLLPRDLDFFVLLSSLAGQIGQAATSQYAAGCTFQDFLARYRVEHGQKAVSLDLGWMRDVGIVAETAAFQRQRLATDDMQQINSNELMALLTLCCDPTGSVASQMLVGLRTPADFLAKGQKPPALLERPFFSAFSRILGTEVISSAGPAAEPAALFRAAAEPEEKAQIVINSLVAKLAHAMSISPEDVELSKPLSSYGVDSLMAVELRNWIRRDFAAPVAVFDIMGGVPISTIGELVVARSTTAPHCVTKG
ncbi:Carrier domain-containing protein [Fusarium sp. LHS14.1]|nr:Carrier domain-containing protein [Fusarium sp. LHS14.1]